MPSGVYKRKTTEEYFWSKVDKTGGINSCWIWKAATLNNKYGHFHVNKVGVSAHRYAYVLQNGDIPEGKVIRHTCNNGLCVNGKHLIIGTQKENINDAVKSLRHCHGEKHGCAILTEKDVKAIRTSNLSAREIATKYNISYYTAWDILKRRSWKHI